METRFGFKLNYLVLCIDFNINCNMMSNFNINCNNLSNFNINCNILSNFIINCNILRGFFYYSDPLYLR